MLAENVHFNAVVNKNFLLNECSSRPTAELNYNTDKKSYSSTQIVIFKMYFTIFQKAFFINLFKFYLCKHVEEKV